MGHGQYEKQLTQIVHELQVERKNEKAGKRVALSGFDQTPWELSLFDNDEFSPSVFCPGFFIATLHGRFLLAVADG